MLQFLHISQRAQVDDSKNIAVEPYPATNSILSYRRIQKFVINVLIGLKSSSGARVNH